MHPPSFTWSTSLHTTSTRPNPAPLDQMDPISTRHAVSDFIGRALQQSWVVVAKERIGTRPESLPVLTRIPRGLLGLLLVVSSREGLLRTPGSARIFSCFHSGKCNIFLSSAVDTSALIVKLLKPGGMPMLLLL